MAAQYTPAIVAPVAERRPIWWMVGSLAERLGTSALPRGVTVADRHRRALLRPLLERSVGGAELLLGSPSGVVASGPVTGWVHERVLPEEGWRLAPAPLIAQLRGALDSVAEVEVGADGGPGTALVLVPHRQLRTMNSQLRDISAAGGAVAVGDGGGPSDGRRRPRSRRHAVEVVSAHGRVTGRLRADERLHRRGWRSPTAGRTPT